jgi:hypothetical protein
VTDDALRQLLAALEARGVEFIFDGINPNVHVRPGRLVAAHEAATLRENKDGIRRLLTADAERMKEEDGKTEAADTFIAGVSAAPEAVTELGPDSEAPRPERRRYDREKDRERRAAAVRAQTERATKEMFFALRYPRDPFNAF